MTNILIPLIALSLLAEPDYARLAECTTILVGAQQTDDGSMIIGRSVDGGRGNTAHLELFHDTDNGPSEFVSRENAFRCPLPPKMLGYLAMPPGRGGAWGEAGFNTAGVGMSSTETINPSPEAEAADPLVTDGVGEYCIYNIVLPYVRTAREGVERLGALIEQYGSREGFGVGFIDKDEVWYLESCAGHRYIAARLPQDSYFVSGNQGRLREYVPGDGNFIASADLVDFAREKGLWNPKDGPFDCVKAYQQDNAGDARYNYTRVYALQKLFSPEIRNDITKNEFPVFAKAKEKISLKKVREGFRNHYDGTDHDPYLHENPHEKYRPVSVFRTMMTHISVSRPWLPAEIGNVTYVAFGMADLGVFIPFYQGLGSLPEEFSREQGQTVGNSVNRKMLLVQSMGKVDYNRYAPVIKERYLDLEDEMDSLQAAFEKEYMILLKENQEKAGEALQSFNMSLMDRALDVTDELIEELLDMLSAETDRVYHFAGD